ncbi:hypothetical protein ACFVGY_09560 [Streptomyces sp. NPDC127106]|uniref:hypothetical protein n=1 Tax=Streptomyces sp. NPDC127106 TaxID=3345360 RepID=UPI0036446BB0
MAGEQRRSERHPPPHVPAVVAPHAGHEQRSCAACGRPVDTLVRRRKVLGIFIPEWVPGPCRNPDCREYAPDAGELP